MKRNQLIQPSHSTLTHFVSFFRKSKSVFNFEFMDVVKLPNSLRSVLRDILEVGNSTPFRNYYHWVAAIVYDYAKTNNIKNIVELGAGCAPITKSLLKKFPEWDVVFSITDLNPDIISLKKLESQDYRVKPIFESFDFTKKNSGFENSLLVLSATFHHVEENKKNLILNNFKALSPHVIIFEPLRPTISSLLFVICSLVSGLLTPIFMLGSKRFFRCFFWCWVIPIAPILFVWDGWVSAFRCWSKLDWNLKEPNALVKESLFCMQVVIKK